MQGVLADSVLSLGLRVVKYPNNSRYVQRFIDAIEELGCGVFSHEVSCGDTRGWVVNAVASGLSAVCETLKVCPPVKPGSSLVHLMSSYGYLSLDCRDDLSVRLLQRMLSVLGVTMGLTEIAAHTSRFVSASFGSIESRLEYLTHMLVVLFESFFTRVSDVVKTTESV